MSHYFANFEGGNLNDTPIYFKKGLFYCDRKVRKHIGLKGGLPPACKKYVFSILYGFLLFNPNNLNNFDLESFGRIYYVGTSNVYYILHCKTL